MNAELCSLVDAARMALVEVSERYDEEPPADCGPVSRYLHTP